MNGCNYCTQPSHHWLGLNLSYTQNKWFDSSVASLLEETAKISQYCINLLLSFFAFSCNLLNGKKMLQNPTMEQEGFIY
jgi:hypothetical protein